METTGSAPLERLDPDEIGTGGLLAASHVHRYELAAALVGGRRVLDLCCGTGYGSRLLARTAASVHGVDISGEAIETARAQLAGEDDGRATFEQADALAYLRSLPQDRFDAVVCFEGVEHVPDPDAVIDELARLAESGARIVLSLPNSRGFDEDNAFHVTDYGFEEMQAAAERLGRALLLEQRLAEASVIRQSPAGGLAAGSGDGDGDGDGHAGTLDTEASGADLHGQLIGDDDLDGDATWANHWLLLTNVDSAEVARARLRLAFAAQPNHSAYMRILEGANAELRRANARLAREQLGRHDAAAAVVVRRLQERADAEEERADSAEAEARKWKDIADANDWGRRQAEGRLNAGAHRLVEATTRRLATAPAAGPLRVAYRVARRRGPTSP